MASIILISISFIFLIKNFLSVNSNIYLRENDNSQKTDHGIHTGNIRKPHFFHKYSQHADNDNYLSSDHIDSHKPVGNCRTLSGSYKADKYQNRAQYNYRLQKNIEYFINTHHNLQLIIQPQFLIKSLQNMIPQYPRKGIHQGSVLCKHRHAAKP